MDGAERLTFIIAAVRAVAPRALVAQPKRDVALSADALLAWAARADPFTAGVLARLSEQERADVRHVLGAMLREHAVTARGGAETSAKCWSGRGHAEQPDH